jgi:hypothetical protein
MERSPQAAARLKLAQERIQENLKQVNARKPQNPFLSPQAEIDLQNIEMMRKNGVDEKIIQEHEIKLYPAHLKEARLRAKEISGDSTRSEKERNDAKSVVGFLSKMDEMLLLAADDEESEEGDP